MMPGRVYTAVTRHIIIPLVRAYSYDEYLGDQLRYSAFTRQRDESRRGLEKAVKTIEDWLHPNAVVLDLGCGDGYFLDFVRPKVRLSMGIDLHLGKLLISLGHRNTGVLADIHALPLSDKTFDVIHTSHAVEHAIDPTTLYSEMHRVLKPGGRVLIVVPASGSISIKHPNLYYDENDIRAQIGRYLQVESIWRDSTREPEFWIVARRL